MHIGDLKPAPGSKRKPKRLGCGIGSGHGKTCGKGHKGESARAGTGKLPVGFEGGQMPLHRRIPKRGFNNARFAKVYQVVNVGRLDERFEYGGVVGPAELFAAGLIKDLSTPVKILGDGELTKPLVVRANLFSTKAKERIEAAGGKAEVI
ncbi:MAG: large subunit ribosomal protein [Synergistaceae bacterium]|nr:large subunit ribosomal protein [Synergistaceae bacterium]